MLVGLLFIWIAEEKRGFASLFVVLLWIAVGFIVSEARMNGIGKIGSVEYLPKGELFESVQDPVTPSGAITILRNHAGAYRAYFLPQAPPKVFRTGTGAEFSFEEVCD